jgi:thioesterase-3
MRAMDIKVRGYHIDVFGHVNNARYLEFLEEARWAFFDNQQGLEDLAREGLVFTVVNINISYRQPAFLNDMLCVETSISKWGNRSAILHQKIKNKKNNKMIADADVTFVIRDAQTQKAAQLKFGLKDRLIKMMEGS